jgi:FecR protein
MAKRLVAATGQRLAALALLGALCACASTSAEPPAEAQRTGWRIVERVGEARYALPGATGWVSAAVGETLADGSEVSTGGGGRLIVDAPGRHISVGPDSRFVLPDPEREDPLDQRAGWLRYRIAAAAAQPFRIHTRSLELELLAGVVDVHVNHRATEVTVKEGQVRVATPDGLRQTQMMAGQSAQAGGSADMQLAVRLAPGAALQRVDPVIVPALHPRSTATEPPPPSAPARSRPAALPALPPADAATVPPADRAAPAPSLAPRPGAASQEARAHSAAYAAPQPVEAPPARVRAAKDQWGAEVNAAAPTGVRSDAPDPATQLVEHRTTESAAAASRRGKFERLTAGMLDQVQPPHQPLIRR